MKKLLRRLHYLVRRDRIDQELAEEIESHRAMRQRELEARGMSAEDAAAASRRMIGNVTLAREDARHTWIAPWLESVAQDVRLSVRLLRRHRGTAAIAILTMGLTIGANTAVYTLLDASLLRSMPVRDPQRLVFVTGLSEEGRPRDFTMPEFERLRDGNRTLAGIAAYDGSRVSVTVAGEPEMALGDFVTGTYFDVLGIEAALGRALTQDDDRPDRPLVAVMSDGYWRRRFGGNPDAVGRSIVLGKLMFTIVGIMPAAFHGRNVTGASADVMLPMVAHAHLALSDHTTFRVIGRLANGATIESATADLETISRSVLAEESAAPTQSGSGAVIQVRSGARGESGGTLGSNDRRQVRIIVVAVGLVLVIGCINVASLLLARGAARRKEVAVRLSLGADRARLIRQFLTESAIIAALGGAAGLLLANWSASLLVQALPVPPLPFDPLRDRAAILFAASASIVSALLFGVLPAVSATGVDVNTTIKSGETGDQSSRVRHRTVKTLVVTQIVVSLMLLVAAALLLRTVQRLYAVDTGVDAEPVLVMGVYPSLLGYDRPREVQLYKSLIARLEETPGIDAASLARYDLGRGEINFIAPRFFRALGIPLVRGRDISDADVNAHARVAVIAESAARLFYAADDPIGRPLPDRYSRMTGGSAPTVVGVVGDIRANFTTEPRPMVYAPYVLAPPTRLGQADIFVRTSADISGLIPAVRRAAQAVEPNLALLNVQGLSVRFDRSLAGRRSTAALLGSFGVLALVLASIGLYGTMSHAVARRTRELGIRLSLGATREQVVRMVLRETAVVIVIAFAIGTPAALIATRGISSLLFGVRAADPVTLGGVLLFMGAVALFAGYVPARRAARVDPIVALRHE